MMPDNGETLRRVQNAIRKFRERDRVLLEIDANERTMTHKLAEYMQQEFQGWEVDCEYNKHIKNLKELPRPPKKFSGLDFWEDTDAKTVYPDIIVHKRESDKENLLVIEAKKSSSKVDDDWDNAKLRAFKRQPYNYRSAVFIKFLVGEKNGVELVTIDG
jgi:hypothetical protein